MKKLFLAAAIFALATMNLSAQAPVNDECATAIDLGNAPACDTSIVYSNVNATLSNIGVDNNPTCFNGGIPNRDVWFSFVCPDTLFDFRVSLFGTGGANGIQNPQVAIYRGECTLNDLFELSCVIAPLGEESVFIDLNGLTPGVTYYIRVSDYSATAAPNSGTFKLCVDKLPEVVTIDQGSSNQCSGTLTDSGGINGDYGPDEDYTFVICPSQPTACITFTLQYFNIEDGFFDALTFYDGEDINAPTLAQISSFGSFGSTVSGGGGVCFKVQGTQPCMTVAFVSDGVTEFEGFLGNWQCSNLPCPPNEQIAVNSPIQDQVIIDAVTSPATQVTITDIICDENAYGAFTYPTTNNDLQMGKGIILTSGLASNIADLGQNFASEILGTPGDNDLDFLSNQQGGQESYDACVVELDVFVATDQLEFEYVFGSEEYPEFVFSAGGYNDIFAFLVSGPGIVGQPGLNGQKNIAVLPGTATPVEINSVNNQVNWEFYRNNEIGQELVYDGLTSDYLGVKKSLTAKTSVTPCNTYHLKLAVADRGDASFDSGVFISEIKGGTPGLAVQFASGIDYFVEGCSGTEDLLVISLPDPLPQATTFITGIGGTAILGTDYILNLPATITFPAGATELSFPIFPLSDALVEGTETITISLSSNFGCGTVLLKTITINLEDQLVTDINAGSDTAYVCLGASYELMATGASTYFWTPSSAVSNPLIPNPTITATQDIWLVVTGSLATCVDIDSIYVKVLDPQLDVTALGTTNICTGNSVALSANNNINGLGLTWSPVDGLSDPTAQQPIASPTVTTTYTATIDFGACITTDQITIQVDTLFEPIVLADTTICQNYPVTLASSVLQTSTYQWTPTTGLSNANASDPLVIPTQTTTYTLTSTSDNGFCSNVQSVTVTVIAADVDIQGPDEYQICLGTTIPLQAVAAPNSGNNVQWSPAAYFNNPTGASTVLNADESLTIYANYTVNGCNVRDSIHITVDSLPDLTLKLRPEKPIYCPGDTVTLLSPTYEPANFPFIKNTWLPDGLGQITPDSLWNLVIRAQVTDTFTRITVNRACRDTSTIVVLVDSLPVISVTASKTAVCPGEVVLLNATVSPDQNVQWSPAAPLSCSDCKNPSATIYATTIFSVTTPDANCPTGASITIEMLQAPALGLPPNTTVCLGDSILLNNAAAEANTTYTWTAQPAGFVSSEAQPSAVPTVPTTYSITATNLACSSTGSVTVEPAIATVDAGVNQNACVGQSIILTATAGSVVGDYTWLANGQPIGNTPQINVAPDGTTIYQVVFTYGGAALCQVSDETLVTINPSPILLSVVTSATTACEGVPVLFYGNIVNGTPPFTYTWTLDGVATQPSAPDTLSLSFVLDNMEDADELHVVGLTVTDANGCPDGPENASVTIKNCFKIPNAFTPSNGGMNNTFEPVIQDGLTTLSNFVIYNRWGQKVFTASPTVKGWDGLVNGNPAPMDVYIYQLTARRPDGTEAYYSGEVTLIR